VRATTHSLLFSWVAVCLLSKSPHLFWPRKARQPQTTTHCRQHVLLHTKPKLTCSRASAARQSASPLVSQYTVCEIGTGPNGVCTHCSSADRRALVCFFHITHTQLCLSARPTHGASFITSQQWCSDASSKSKRKKREVQAELRCKQQKALLPSSSVVREGNAKKSFWEVSFWSQHREEEQALT
jgi:hypothetical protein